jgi:hypothetical protein
MINASTGASSLTAPQSTSTTESTSAEASVIE